MTTSPFKSGTGQQFPIGTRVQLRGSGSSEIGVVAGFEGVKIRVFWPLCRNEGKYWRRSLIQVTGAVKVKFFEKEKRT